MKSLHKIWFDGEVIHISFENQTFEISEEISFIIVDESMKKCPVEIILENAKLIQK